MTDDPRLQQMAEKLLKARADAMPIRGETPASGPADNQEAYEVQRLVAAELGPAGAFKTGRRLPGDPVTMAPIPAAMVRASPASFGPRDVNLIGIELEVAFRVHSALPSAEDPEFAERARRAVSALAAIEIIDSRLADHDAAGALWKLADNQINGGLVPGAAVADWSGLDLATPNVRLEVDGEVVAHGPTAVPGGDAYHVFCAFARSVGRHCGGLVPGQYVTTGSLTLMRFIERRGKVTGHVAGLGSVSVDFPLE